MYKLSCGGHRGGGEPAARGSTWEGKRPLAETAPALPYSLERR